jgi:uncharacterized protein YoaH (UPF0181 family)
MNKNLSQLIALVIIVGIAAVTQYFYRTPNTENTPSQTTTQHGSQQQAIEKIRQAVNSGDTEASFWVTLDAQVIKTLRDDTKGSQHQRFLIEPSKGMTLLVAHNIDLADKVPLAKGDNITLRGRYEWNNKGGVVHWTHHDPRGKKAGGWIKAAGKTYR